MASHRPPFRGSVMVMDTTMRFTGLQEDGHLRMSSGREEAVRPPEQELEVIRLIASGHKDYVIAKRLGVSIVTVRRRVFTFRARVGARTRSEAVARAAALGWLDPDPMSAPVGEIEDGPVADV